MRRVIGAIAATGMLLTGCGTGDGESLEGDAESAADEVAAGEAELPTQDDLGAVEAPAEEPGAEPSEEEPATAPDADPTLELADEYLGFMSEPSPRTIEGMAELTVEGSDAHAYASFIVSQVLAHVADGYDVTAWRIRGNDGGFEVCTDTCIRYHDFEESGGLLTTFSLGDRPLEGRIVGPAEPIEVGPATVRATSSYEASSEDSLIVSFVVEAHEAVSVGVASAEYVGPGGSQQTASAAVGPFDLRSGASAHYMVLFPAADLGGTLYVPIWDDASTAHEAEVPTRQ